MGLTVMLIVRRSTRDAEQKRNGPLFHPVPSHPIPPCSGSFHFRSTPSHLEPTCAIGGDGSLPHEDASSDRKSWYFRVRVFLFSSFVSPGGRLGGVFGVCWCVLVFFFGFVTWRAESLARSLLRLRPCVVV